MRDKNENIHLWLLEQYRKKDQARLHEEAEQEGRAEPVSILNNTWANNYISCGIEADSSPIDDPDLTRLFNEKTILEEELRRSDEEIKNLEMRTRTLSSRIIQMMKQINAGKRQEIRHLRVKVEVLESQIRRTCPL